MCLVAAATIVTAWSANALAYGGYAGGGYGGYGSTGEKVGTTYNEPDAGSIRIAATVYYAMIARHFFNWGGHGQITLTPTPGIELQGAGMLNLPGSGIALFRVEGSAFLALSSLRAGNVVTASSVSGNYRYTQYVPVPEAQRNKFGLELGGFLDRHGVNYWPSDDFRHDGQSPIPILALGAFGGFKWVRQMYVGLTNGASNRVRWAFFIHGMYALKQSIDLPAGETDAKYARVGGRLGVEVGPTADTGMFMRAEGGAMPSIRGPDFNMFIMVGVAHGQSVF